ncbi:MAG: glycoside hydrolase family 15 protein [Chloroflexi bacterium]|nr:glycoside hydrolase family 15 protein [Chloroflexota bacterium]
MPRDLPLGNGHLLINFDGDYNIRDIYYPYVGKANHSHRCISRTGIWAEGQFSWLSESGWLKQLEYLPDTLATNVVATHEKLMLKVVVNDVVDFHRDVFFRRVEVFNLGPTPREIRVFFHYDFRFWGVGNGDSIQYDPDDDALIAYKDDCYFLINGSIGDVIGISGWTTGNRDEKGEGGSWLDAEDGVLGRRASSSGAVDGVIALHWPNLAKDESTVFYTWLAAGRDNGDVRMHNLVVNRQKPQYFIDRTVNYWRAWVNKEDIKFHDLPESVQRLYKRSLLIIRTNIDERGGIVAGNDSDLTALANGFESYSYVWPRDGAYIANALDKAGYAYLAANFYNFCADVIYTGQSPWQVQGIADDEGYMLHKYTPERRLASNWMPLVDEEGNRHLPIQEDETALIPYCLWQHYGKFRDIENIKPWFLPLIIQTGNFMSNFREPATKLPAPSFDLWEERRAIYSYTAATVWAGLQACANFAEMFGEQSDALRYGLAAAEIKEACEIHLYDEEKGRFLKSITVKNGEIVERDDNVDASLYGLWYFGMFEPLDPRIIRTMTDIEEKLLCRTEVGGLARYVGDEYNWDPTLDERRSEIPGNPWFICTLWIAQYRIARARSLEDLKLVIPWINWVCSRALPSGALAEQLDPLTGKPVGVSPLTWSHATLVATVQEYIDKYEGLQNGHRE